MKTKSRFLAPLLAFLLAFAGTPAAVARQTGDAAPAPAFESAPAGKGRRAQDSYVIYRDADGETFCRDATAVENERIAMRTGGGGKRLIYAGAPRLSDMPADADAKRPYATLQTGQALLPSAGLRIFLHGTPQLEANAAAKNAFIVAANRWEALISTRMTVVLDVDFGTTFFGEAYREQSILGQTGTSRTSAPLSTVRRQLLATSSSAGETALYNALPTTSLPVELNGAAASAASVSLAWPNARALGLVPDIANPDAVALEDGDAGIGFNSVHPFDFNPDNGIASSSIDFDAVVVHEIGHALGFTSNSGGASASPVTMWDVFRFRPGAATLATFATAPRVMTKGANTSDPHVFFNNRTNSFGGAELQLSTGGPSGTGGDEEQSSHWKDDVFGPFIGIMDPRLRNGERETIRDNDLSALDSFGYTIGGTAPPPPAPPPGPANDNFASAVVLQGAAGSVSGSNISATREAGEPDPSHEIASRVGLRSVWYRWTAPASGQATFDTLNSDYDSTLGVYTGASVGALSPAGPSAENDDIDTANGVLASRVTFTASAGATYQVMVNGWNSDTGSIVLNWSLSGTPPPTPTPTPTPIPPTPTPTPTPPPIPPTPTPTPSSSLRLGSTAYAGVEHDGFVGVTVLRSGDTTATQTVHVVATNGTALGMDYNVGLGLVTFQPGETRKAYSLLLNDDAEVEGSETFNVALFGPSGGAAIGSLSSAVVTIHDNDGFPASTIGFSGPPVVNVSEGAGKVELTVVRSGDRTQPATVYYKTEDLSTLGRRDYSFSAGALRFAPGEESKTITVLVNDDSYAEQTEYCNVVLRSPVGATVGGQNFAVQFGIVDNDAQNGPNPLNGTNFFVGQHYADFLNRQGDAGGLAFWGGGIDSCGADSECARVKRINTSAAFFLSIEFQETGYFVYRLYKAAHGDLSGAPVPVRFEDFIPDTLDIGRGVVVGVGDWPRQLENNRAAYVSEFVTRGRFRAAFPSDTTPAQFVEALNRNVGNLLTPAEVASLTNQLAANNTEQGRASVLRQVAENATLRSAEFNKAFVLMQYFGYMRRNPNDAPDADFAGFTFWLGQLERNGGNFERAEMVRAFIESIEYGQRFGP